MEGSHGDSKATVQGANHGWFNDIPARDRAAVDAVKAKMAQEGLAVKKETLGGDVYVARFVRARKHDVEAAFSMLKANLQWRDEKKVDSVLDWFAASEAGKKLLSFFPNQPFGSAGGVPLVLEHMTLLDPAEVLETFSLDDLVTLHIYLVERDLLKCYEMSCESNKAITEVTIVENMQGLGFRHLASNCIEMLKALLAVDEANYPELLHQMIIINAPSIVHIGFRVLRPFIDAATLAKIQIHGGSWKTSPQLLALVPLDCVAKEWGGECATRHWHQSGALKAEEEESGEAIDVAVAASVKADHELQVEQDGSSFFYQFEVANHDIGFSVELLVGNKKPRVLVPLARHEGQQAGVIHGIGKGKLVVTLDNSYSYLTAKQVRLTATVRPPLSRAQKRKEKKNRNKERKANK